MNLAILLTAALVAVSNDPADEAPEATPADTTASTSSTPVDTPTQPSAFERWWNGQEAIYDTGFNMSFGLVFSNYNGGEFVTTGTDDDFDSANVESTFGFRGEIGTMGRHFGLLILGGAYYVAGEGTALVANGGPAAITLRGVDVRLLHPRLRFAMWRFEAAASLGPVAHLGWAKLDESRLPKELGGLIDPKVRDALDSSVFATLGLEAGLGLRFYPISLLFVEGSYNYSFPIWNILGETNGMNGFRIGAGLAF
jgi:hypothetical protein